MKKNWRMLPLFFILFSSAWGMEITSKINFLDFPNEVQVEICKSLDSSSLANMSLVNKSSREVVFKVLMDRTLTLNLNQKGVDYSFLRGHPLKRVTIKLPSKEYSVHWTHFLSPKFIISRMIFLIAENPEDDLFYSLHLSSLKSLKVGGYNPSTDLFRRLFQKRYESLETLDCSYLSLREESIKDLIYSLPGYFPYLQNLNVSGNTLGMQVYPLIRSLPLSLKSLELRKTFQSLTRTPEIFAEILETFPNLEILDISDNNCEIYLKEIKNPNDFFKLRTLNLKNNKIPLNSAEKVKIFGKFLSLCPHLEVLNLLGCEIDGPLKKIIKMLPVSIRELDLSSIERLDNLEAKDFRKLGRNLSNYENLRVLKIMGGFLNPEKMGVLAPLLPSFLTELYLNGHPMGSSGIQALAENEELCRNLKVLSFRNNGLSPKDLENLSGKLPLLEKFYLEDFRMEGGAASLSDVLSSSHQLRVLSLFKSTFQPKDIKFITFPSSLEKLDFGLSKIKKNGVKFLIERLGRSHSLKWINLSENGINDQGAEMLADALKKGAFPCLEGMYLGRNNNIKEKGKESLANSGRGNIISYKLCPIW